MQPLVAIGLSVQHIATYTIAQFGIPSKTVVGTLPLPSVHIGVVSPLPL